MSYLEKKINNIKAELFTKLDPWLNFSTKRGRKSNDMSKVNTIVLHWTADTSIESTINGFRAGGSNGNSYHFLIGKNAVITQTVPLSKKAWHAGHAYGPTGSNVGFSSIGISMDFSNGDDLESNLTEEMYQSVVNLIADLKIAVPSLEYITGHHWVAPGRKVDPWNFNFKKLLNEPKIKATNFKIWKTGDLPFPRGLNNCHCVKYKIPDDNTSKCLKSTGTCDDGTYTTYKGKTSLNRYSKRRLEGTASGKGKPGFGTDISLDSDMITDESSD